MAMFSIAILSCSSCYKEAQESSKTSNAKFQIELLFVSDGIKVYRFEDGGRSIYYTDARGSTITPVGSGKTISYIEVQTNK